MRVAEWNRAVGQLRAAAPGGDNTGGHKTFSAPRLTLLSLSVAREKRDRDRNPKGRDLRLGACMIARRP